MKKYYGKKIDPASFKQDDIANLEQKIEESRQKAKKYSEKTSIFVDSCEICDASNAKLAQQVYNYRYVQCEKCGHVYLEKRLSEDILEEYYRESEKYADTYTDEEQIEYRLQNVTKPKYDFILENISADQGRWLDVGCGIGASVNYLDSKGWDAVGIDVSQHSIRTGEEMFGVDLRQQTLAEFMRENSKNNYDVISFMGYFDVVPNPQRDFEHAISLLGTEGNIAVGVQQYASISTLVQQQFNNQVTRHLIPPNIVQMFTQQSLQQLYQLVGAEVEAAWFFGLDFYTFLNNLCLNIKGFQGSKLYEFCMKNYNDFQEVIDRNEMSDYLLTVGRYTGS